MGTETIIPPDDMATAVEQGYSVCGIDMDAEYIGNVIDSTLPQDLHDLAGTDE